MWGTFFACFSNLTKRSYNCSNLGCNFHIFVPFLLIFLSLTTSALSLPQYVVVSSKKILFYSNEQDKEQSIPYMVLDIE